MPNSQCRVNCARLKSQTFPKKNTDGKVELPGGQPVKATIIVPNLQTNSLVNQLVTSLYVMIGNPNVINFQYMR